MNANALTVTLPPIGVTEETAASLTTVAEALDRSRSWVMRVALVRFLREYAAVQAGPAE